MIDNWQIMIQLLVEAAKAKGISRYAIAKEAGISESTVMRVFNLDFCPKLNIYLDMARAVGLNVFFEDDDADTDLTKLFEKAMEDLGRRPDQLPKN